MFKNGWANFRIKIRIWTLADYVILFFAIAIFSLIIFVGIAAFLAFDRLSALSLVGSICIGGFFLLACLGIWFYRKFKHRKAKNENKYPAKPRWMM